MDQLSCMRVFARVVEHGSFARAAEDLDVAKPAVSIAVARLEKRLGVRLLHRTTRTLSLTDEGRAYYEGCVRILDDLAETEDSLSKARARPRGRLRVSTPNAFIHQAFITELPRFLERNPELSVELVLTDRAVNLVEEGIDCAVRAVNIPDDSTLVARRISDVYWLTCASPRYLQANGTPRTIAELAGHNCIRFVSPSTNRLLDWRFDNGEEQVTFTPRGSLGVTSLEGAAAAAAAGVGIAQVSDVLAMPQLRSGSLRPLFVDWVVPGPPLQVVYPGGRYLTAKVRAFTDFVAEIYPMKGWWEEVTAMAARSSLPLARSGDQPGKARKASRSRSSRRPGTRGAGR
jgi:LysR family transcriptional regulator for bpeEF and oprC